MVEGVVGKSLVDIAAPKRSEHLSFDPNLTSTLTSSQTSSIASSLSCPKFVVFRAEAVSGTEDMQLWSNQIMLKAFPSQEDLVSCLRASHLRED